MPESGERRRYATQAAQRSRQSADRRGEPLGNRRALRREAEDGAGVAQVGERRGQRQRRGTGLFRELGAVSGSHQRRVQVARRRQAEQALQQDLPGRAVGEVFAANDVGDVLLGVVDDDGELIGEDAVGALEDEVADRAGDVLALLAEASVVPGDLGVGAGVSVGVVAGTHPQPHRACGPAAEAGAAGAGIDALVAFAFAGRRRRRQCEIASAAGARKGTVEREQALQRRFIKPRARRLMDDRRVGDEAHARELIEDRLGRAGDVARRVEVLDANQPASAVGARVEPRGERGDERAGVEKPGGRGREAADVRR